MRPSWCALRSAHTVFNICVFAGLAAVVPCQQMGPSRFAVQGSGSTVGMIGVIGFRCVNPCNLASAVLRSNSLLIDRKNITLACDRTRCHPQTSETPRCPPHPSPPGVVQTEIPLVDFVSTAVLGNYCRNNAIRVSLPIDSLSMKSTNNFLQPKEGDAHLQNDDITHSLRCSPHIRGLRLVGGRRRGRIEPHKPQVASVRLRAQAP